MYTCSYWIATWAGSISAQLEQSAGTRGKTTIRSVHENFVSMSYRLTLAGRWTLLALGNVERLLEFNLPIIDSRVERRKNGRTEKFEQPIENYSILIAPARFLQQCSYVSLK
jgi:hypothetical protein